MALDLAVSTNRFLKADLDPTTSRNPFVEAVAFRAASKDRKAFVEAAEMNL